MPVIEVKAFERRFADEAQTKQLIAALTDAMASVYGDDVRPETWVIVEGVAPARWGFGGEVRA
jgi:4-oxalocrotonate tautomerase